MKAICLLCLLILLVILCSSSTFVTSQHSCSDPNYQYCIPIWEAHNVVLKYSQASSELWSFAFSFPITSINSYVAMGFSKNKGRMVGSSALVAWVDLSSGSQNEWGYGQYYLGGTINNQVLYEQGQLPYFSDSIVYSNTSAELVFKLPIKKPSPYLIFSVGPYGFFPSPPNYFLTKHNDKISIHIDYASGKFKVITNSKLKRSHGVINIVGWTVLLIIGAIISRHCKQWDPVWFYLHASIQTLAFVGGLVGIICGVVLSKRVSTTITPHKNIGILILLLGFLQILALKLRPGKESKIRKYWNYYHHNMGRILFIFAFANTFYGLHLGDEGSKWFLAYGITIAILFLLAIVLEIRMRFMKSKPPPMPNQIDMSYMYHY